MFHQPAMGGAAIEPLIIGMLLHPGFTLLELAGPQAALGLHGQAFLFWKSAESVHERVVADRNRISGGVTAGVDLDLTSLATLCGEQTAKVTQLMLEYDPKPPFDCGVGADE